jgi:hypothetical protein
MHPRGHARRQAGSHGGAGSVVEVNETFIGQLEGQPKGKDGYAHKSVVLTLVERGGSARSFHIDNASIASIVPILRANINRETDLMTDEARHYMNVGGAFASHGAVHHAAKEYARGEPSTNAVEGFYSIFKRGMKGVYQHCGEKHLHRYLAEFDFRYSNALRLALTIRAVLTRRLRGWLVSG